MGIEIRGYHMEVSIIGDEFYGKKIRDLQIEQEVEAMGERLREFLRTADVKRIEISASVLDDGKIYNTLIVHSKERGVIIRTSHGPGWVAGSLEEARRTRAINI